ncbi:MAG: carboxypeptidase regulatory-like domain-containing protein [Planctomycetes bacterium]|nr:carboxypeptidase regulatory-like domain-containing protein [Planctomycetota bacterium]
MSGARVQARPTGGFWTLLGEDQRWRHEAWRDGSEVGEGEYRIDRLPAGHCQVWASAPGFAPSDLEGADAPSEDPVCFRLEPGKTIRGTVRTRDGEPIPGAYVAAGSSLSVGPDQGARAGADGRFVVEDLGEGPFEVEAFAAGFAAAEARGVSAGTEDLAFTLDPAPPRTAVPAAGPALGVVLDAATDLPVPDAAIGVAPWPGGGWREVRGISDGAGRFRLEGLSPGAYLLEVRARGYLRETFSLKLVETGSASDLELRLERGGALAGRVLDLQGRAVPGARVYPFVLPGAEGSEAYVADERGRAVADAVVWAEVMFDWGGEDGRSVPSELRCLLGARGASTFVPAGGSP